MEIRPLSQDQLEDFGTLQRSQPESTGCWCMWFVRPVADYHASGDAGNRAAHAELLGASDVPTGLLAYSDEGDVVGWCAAGPRSRYVRAVKTPTMNGRDQREDDEVWLVPCFLIHPQHRRQGVATALLEAAVDLAARSGARAVEGFPLSGSKKRSKSADFMTGSEPLFAGCGFYPVRRPSNNRVIMRRELRKVS